MDENLQVQNEENEGIEKPDTSKPVHQPTTEIALNNCLVRDSMPEKLKKALEAGLKQ